MWKTFTEILKFPGNIVFIVGVVLIILSFANVSYAKKDLMVELSKDPNWYLLICGMLFCLMSSIIYFHSQKKDKKPIQNIKIKNNKDTINWLPKFQKIGVEPLYLYGFEGNPSPAIKFEVYCVHVMWADPRGNSIKVLLDNDQCKITFENIYTGSYPSDFAIRPSGHQPLANINIDGNMSHSLLVINLQNITEKNPETISVGIRVVDRLGTHWSYAKSGDYHFVTNINPGETKEAICDLNSKHWVLFTPDGNRQYHVGAPDFSIIPAVIIEVGGPNGNRRPSVGRGTILLKGIYLRD